MSTAEAIFEMDMDAAAASWRGVFCEGPEPDQDADGEEIPVWSVYVGDQDADPVGQVYTCHSYRVAVQLAARIAEDRRLKCVMEASPA